MAHHDNSWFSGSAAVEITPDSSQFLYGYPHFLRYSQGVHDPILASAIALSDGRQQVILIGCDIIWVPRGLARRARDRIEQTVGVSWRKVLITATHTHSAPITANILSNRHDPMVPPPDPAYLRLLEDAIVQAAVQAHQRLVPAIIEYAIADGSQLGTNRRDPDGPFLPQIPLWIVRDQKTTHPIALMPIVTMHPTVLHEDWMQISGDFPGLARQWLQSQPGIGPKCVMLHHMGASGNQSPRHKVKANTIDQAKHLGQVMGQTIRQAMAHATPIKSAVLRLAWDEVELPLRRFPSEEQARQRLNHIKAKLEQMIAQNAPRSEIRTIECDWFGAQETVTLSGATLEERTGIAKECLPAEITVLSIGDQRLVFWPGEAFVEYALDLRQYDANAWLVTLCHGDLQGYLVTQQAVDEGGYEASNALFESPAAGQYLMKHTQKLLDDMGQERDENE